MDRFKEQQGANPAAWGAPVMFILVVLVSAVAVYLSIASRQDTVGSYLDFYIFINNARHFLDTGLLYEQDLSLYGPGASVYKYPPLYGALLVLGLQQGIEGPTLGHVGWLLQIACWLAAFIVMCRHCRVFSSDNKRLLLGMICLFWFANDYFKQNAYRLQVEPYILLMLALALRDFDKKQDLRSGVWIGLAAALKVYPLFLLPLFVLLQRWRALPGFLLGIACSLALTLPLLGWSEHMFYLLDVFPVLMQEGVSGFYENVSIARMLVPYTMIHPEIRQDFPQLFTHSVAAVCLLITAVRVLVTRKQSPAYTGASIDFAAVFSVMLVYMPNFWWNYQILNLLPGTIAICLCLAHCRQYWLPLLLLVAMLLLQVAITAPELWQAKFTDVAFEWLQDPGFVIVRGSIQILLLVAVLLAQWISHRAITSAR